MNPHDYLTFLGKDIINGCLMSFLDIQSKMRLMQVNKAMYSTIDKDIPFKNWRSIGNRGDRMIEAIYGNKNISTVRRIWFSAPLHIDQDLGLKAAARMNNEKLIQFFLLEKAEPKYGIIGAFSGGHYSMVHQLQNKYSVKDRDYISAIVQGGAESGDVSIIEKAFKSQGMACQTCFINIAIRIAAKYGHLDVIKYISRIFTCPLEYAEAGSIAIKYGHLETGKYLNEKSVEHTINIMTHNFQKIRKREWKLDEGELRRRILKDGVGPNPTNMLEIYHIAFNL